MTLVTVESAADLAAVARELIAAAGGDLSRVRVVTTGRLPAFEVDQEVVEALAAKRSGTAPEPAPQLVPEPEPAPVVSIPIEMHKVDNPAPKPPKRNASTAMWAAFMAAAPFFLDGAETMERAALIAAYDAWIADHA